MILEDFVVLGKTVPEQSKKYGTRVCMAGYSKEYGSLIRVYPWMPSNTPATRSQLQIRLVRNPADSRKESFRMHPVDAGMQISGKADQWKCRQMLESCLVNSVQEANEKKLSLAVICPHSVKLRMARRKEVQDPAELLLFDDVTHCIPTFKTASDYHQCLYCDFQDEGGLHRLQLREWGCYEAIRKHSADSTWIGDALRVRSDRDCLLLIGNMNAHRSTWLVINLWTYARVNTPDLFSAIPTQTKSGTL